MTDENNEDDMMDFPVPLNDRPADREIEKIELLSQLFDVAPTRPAVEAALRELASIANDTAKLPSLDLDEAINNGLIPKVTYRSANCIMRGSTNPNRLYVTTDKPDAHGYLMNVVKYLASEWKELGDDDRDNYVFTLPEHLMPDVVDKLRGYMGEVRLDDTEL